MTTANFGGHNAGLAVLESTMSQRFRLFHVHELATYKRCLLISPACQKTYWTLGLMCLRL